MGNLLKQVSIAIFIDSGTKGKCEIDGKKLYKLATGPKPADRSS